MCGLVGVGTVEPDSTIDAALGRAVEMLLHRGPEASGLAVFTAHGRTCTLGHTRLRIIDVREAADQPLANEDGTVQVVFNGELYNFVELRTELEGAGHRFATESDTEVLVHLYESVGGDAARLLERLRGMFAFALFDVTRGRLLLARDRLGIKPMYHATLPGGGIAFASEMQALIGSGLVPAGPDTGSMIGYLLWGSVQGPTTIAGGVRELPPASYLVWDGDGAREVQWWAPEFSPQPIDEPDAALAEVLHDCVARHLVADREVGLFLSGGVDSGAIASVAARQGPIRSLTVTFPDDLADEGHEAADLANRLALRHVEVPVTGAEVAAALPAIARAMDQPTDDGVNTWIVSKAARDAGLVVALSGLGGDELFGGYGSFSMVPRAAVVGAALQPVPGSIRRLAADLLVARRPGAPLSRLLTAPSGIGSAYRAVRGLFGVEDLARMGTLRWIGEQDAIQLFTPDSPDAEDPRDAVALLELGGYMRNQLLRDTDAMSMSHSLEVRVPLLDDRVVDLALSLPADVRNEHGKALLQRAAGFRHAGPKQRLHVAVRRVDAWPSARDDARSAVVGDTPALLARDPARPSGPLGRIRAGECPLVEALGGGHASFVGRRPSSAVVAPAAIGGKERSGLASLDDVRILMVSYTYPPFLQMGGPPRKVAALAREVARRGHRVDVLTVNHDLRRPGFEREEDGVRAHYVRSVARYRGTATINPSFPRQVRRRANAADVVHIFGLYDLLGPSAAKAARSSNVPYVLEPLGMFRPIGRSLRKKRLYHAAVGDRLMSGAAAIVATSELEREALTDDGIPPDRIVLRPNGVDLVAADQRPERGRFRARHGIASDTPLILFLGRLAPVKRPDLVIEILSSEGLTSAYAAIVGPDEDGTQQALETRAAVLGVGDRVVFAGPMYGPEKSEALVDADVLVLPSESENFGNVVLEALALGVPVVVSDRCGVAAVVDDRVGSVVPLRVDSMAEAVRTVLHDPSIRGTAERVGPLIAAPYRWPNVAAQMESIYASALEGAAR